MASNTGLSSQGSPSVPVAGEEVNTLRTGSPVPHVGNSKQGKVLNEFNPKTGVNRTPTSKEEITKINQLAAEIPAWVPPEDRENTLAPLVNQVVAQETAAMQSQADAIQQLQKQMQETQDTVNNSLSQGMKQEGEVDKTRKNELIATGKVEESEQERKDREEREKKEAEGAQQVRNESNNLLQATSTAGVQVGRSPGGQTQVEQDINRLKSGEAGPTPSPGLGTVSGPARPHNVSMASAPLQRPSGSKTPQIPENQTSTGQKAFTEGPKSAQHQQGDKEAQAMRNQAKTEEDQGQAVPPVDMGTTTPKTNNAPPTKEQIQAQEQREKEKAEKEPGTPAQSAQTVGFKSESKNPPSPPAPGIRLP
jgi:hypothetical protein